MDYNKFHYYRSNPYSQEGFIPPIAHKNRNHTSFLPQGQSVFTHDTRKHFIDATNRSNI